MAEIFPNPELPNYFVNCDWNDLGSRRGVLSHYESGHVILVGNKRIEFDDKFFGTFEFPTGKQYKKFKIVQYVQSFDRKNIYPDLADDCFHGDHGKEKYFKEQMESIVDQYSEILHAAAPQYNITRPSVTLRATTTFNENLHVDVYKQEIPTHHFRMFVNLDNSHRIWRTSWCLEEILQTRLSELPLDTLRTACAGDLIKALNFHVFGGRQLTFEDRGLPTHTAFFEPGEVWFVDSRQVSHQIFYGRSAISSESSVEPTDMLDKERHYLSLAERYRAQLLVQ